MIEVHRLTSQQRGAAMHLLEQDPRVNLFLLAFLQSHGLDNAWWYGAWRPNALVGLVMLLPGRLLVPWCPDPDAATALGTHLHHYHQPCMLVGPRAAADAVWAAWAAPNHPTRCWFDQRLYMIETPLPHPPVPGFRRATLDDMVAISLQAGLMEEEDLGVNPHRFQPEVHNQVVRERIVSGRTWVIERDHAIVFQINVGTACEWGCQVGGTYVPPLHRRQGLAKLGMVALCHALLADYSRVTLHVNEANTAAVHTYEAAGLQRHAAYRLVTLPPSQEYG